jgi:hypothetical protein
MSESACECGHPESDHAFTRGRRCLHAFADPKRGPCECAGYTPSAACEHVWRQTNEYRDSDRPHVHGIPLVEGVLRFACTKCGAIGQSEPMTGIVREDVVQRG